MKFEILSIVDVKCIMCSWGLHRRMTAKPQQTHVRINKASSRCPFTF